MFNFNVMNRALSDSNLSDKAFRMLYTITNYCSLKNSNSVEIHNAHFMTVLNISERWVRKITNELVENNYITKTINGTSKNKLANTYELINVEVNDTPTDSVCDNDIVRGNKQGNKSDAQKYPLKNNKKININNITKVNDHTTSGPKNEIEVIEDTNNETLSLDELLNTTNRSIKIDGVTYHTITPIRESLFIPVEEVCDSSEQREEEKTNDINETKQQVELRSLTNDTSTEGVSLTLSDISISRLDNNEHSNNEINLYNPTYFLIKTPSPLCPDTSENTNDNLKDMEKELEEALAEMNAVAPTTNLKNDEFSNRIKLINDCINDYKQNPKEETKALINSHVSICKWWFEKNEITQKQMEWVKKIKANFEKITEAIYINNKTKRNKAVLSHSNNEDNKSISRSDEAQQEANKVANFRYYSSDEQTHFEELIKTGGKEADLKSVVDYIKCHYNGYPALKLEKLESFCNKTDFNNAQSWEIIKVLKDYILENIK